MKFANSIGAAALCFTSFALAPQAAAAGLSTR